MLVFDTCAHMLVVWDILVYVVMCCVYRLIRTVKRLSDAMLNYGGHTDDHHTMMYVSVEMTLTGNVLWYV